MSEETYWKSRTYVKRGQVKLVDSSKGFMRFEVGEHDVFRDKNDWSCNAAVIDKRDGIKKGCVVFGNRDRYCSHILACQQWLRGEGL